MSRFFHIGTLLLAIGLTGTLATGCGDEAPDQTAEADEMTQLVHHRVEKVLDDLDATEPQRTQVHAIKDELMEPAKQMRKHSEEAHQQLRDEWAKDAPDAERVHLLVDQRIDELRTMAHRTADAALALHGVLTPEQRTALADKMMERRSKWRAWHKRFGADKSE